MRHVAVGASSPIPGSGALLARALSERDAPKQQTRVSILGSKKHNAFTNGGVELFDMAATGRIDAFFSVVVKSMVKQILILLDLAPTRKVRFVGLDRSDPLIFTT